VAYFQELLTHYQKEIVKSEDREIKRKPGNPMLRHTVAKNDPQGSPINDDLDLTRGMSTPQNLLPITETIKTEGVINGHSTI